MALYEIIFSLFEGEKDSYSVIKSAESARKATAIFKAIHGDDKIILSVTKIQPKTEFQKQDAWLRYRTQKITNVKLE